MSALRWGGFDQTTRASGPSGSTGLVSQSTSHFRPLPVPLRALPAGSPEAACAGAKVRSGDGYEVSTDPGGDRRRHGRERCCIERRRRGRCEKGEVLAYTCHGCHGVPDYQNAYPNYSVPKLGGQSAPYLAERAEGVRLGRTAASDDACAGGDAV